VTGEGDLWTDANEPSPDDFEAADEARPPVGPRAVLFGALRAAGLLLVIVALLLYFVVPFRSVVSSVVYRLRLPSPKIHTLPLAPQREAAPKLPV
jgi:hypothetical protein